MKYIKKLAEESIWNAGLVELFDLSRANLNEESREEVVTFIASECYGSEPNDRKKLYNKLLTEHCGGPASSLEFVRHWEDLSLRGCLRNNPEMLTFEEHWSDIINSDFMTSAVFNGLATFRLEVPVFLAQQITRHRQFAYQALSRRFQDDDKCPFMFWIGGDGCVDLADQAAIFSPVLNDAVCAYKRAVADGVRPEVARGVIPQSAYTTYWMQGDIPAWANYFNVRLDAKVQQEHQELAKAMFAMLRKHKPRFFEHMHGYVDNGAEVEYNCNSSRIDTAEEAKRLGECLVTDFASDRPDKWD